MNVHIPVFSIGALAKASGVTAPTIRFYEEIGLIPRARRSASGQRYFDEADLSRLIFVKQCRDFGFGIDQVRLLLDLAISSERDCVETRDLAQVHLDEVRSKLVDLRSLETRLSAFVERCNAACLGGPGSDCVIFKDLVDREPGPCCGGSA